jgi:hypothetical protein
MRNDRESGSASQISYFPRRRQPAAAAHIGLEQKISEESIQFVQKGSDRTGLLNIFYRLKILYQDEAVFRIENLPERGSIVTIGGLILNIPPDNTQ